MVLFLNYQTAAESRQISMNLCGNYRLVFFIFCDKNNSASLLLAPILKACNLMLIEGLKLWLELDVNEGTEHLGLKVREAEYYSLKQKINVNISVAFY